MARHHITRVLGPAVIQLDHPLHAAHDCPGEHAVVIPDDELAARVVNVRAAVYHALHIHGTDDVIDAWVDRAITDSLRGAPAGS